MKGRFLRRFFSPKRRRLLKHMGFSLLALILFLVIISFILEQLERRKLIETERPDDHVLYAPLNIFTIDNTPNGPFYRIVAREMMPLRFPVDKPENTFRIAITGSSFAMGTPYVHPNWEAWNESYLGYGGIPDWLRAELTLRYPSQRIEVLNLAAGAQNTYRIKEIVKDIMEINPDLLILATGNNEGYVPETRFNQDLQRWIIYRALKKVLLPEPSLEERSYFTPQDPDTAKIEHGYRQNIEEMITTTREHRVPLLLATLPINLKYHGYVNTHGEPPVYPQDDPYLKQGLKLAMDGNCEQAVEVFAQSENQLFAAFEIAKCLERLERYTEAREFYKIYVQQNPLNRIRPSYNVFLREVSQQEGVYLADLEKTLEDLSPHGLPDPHYFHDYCHMTWKGYQLMSQTISDTIIANHLLTGKTGEPLPRPSREEMIQRFGMERLLTVK